jgi:hypothetical protein
VDHAPGVIPFSRSFPVIRAGGARFPGILLPAGRPPIYHNWLIRLEDKTILHALKISLNILTIEIWSFRAADIREFLIALRKEKIIVK